MKITRSQIFFAVSAILVGLISLQAQIPRASERQIQNLLSQIQSRTIALRQEISREHDRRRPNDRAVHSNILNSLADLDRATKNFQASFRARMANSGQVSDMLNNASNIDRWMREGRVSSAAGNRWNDLRRDLDTLARYYSVSWNWDDSSGPVRRFPGGSIDSRLTGSYRLNTALSDRVDTVLDRSLGSVRASDRNRFRRGIERRLEAPEELAIQKSGQSVTIASNLASPVTLQADGVVRTETTARGQTVRTTASTDRNGITINTDGDRATDFRLSFAVDRNNRLRVTRTLFMENQSTSVSSTSVYDKVSEVARWPAVDRRTGGRSTGTTANFYIPDGTQVSAILRNRISSRASQPGDRFTMEITSPNRYRGAIIEGSVIEAERSGRLAGRANISLQFDTIRHNNRTYQFAGIVDSAQLANGDNVTVNNEGTVRDSSQTTRTVTRTGVGAALGALIGAIAGGGTGAAVGAGIGAGVGAGSVLIQGRDNIEMDQGSTFSITATAPQGVAVVR